MNHLVNCSVAFLKVGVGKIVCDVVDALCFLVGKKFFVVTLLLEEGCHGWRLVYEVNNLGLMGEMGGMRPMGLIGPMRLMRLMRDMRGMDGCRWRKLWGLKGFFVLAVPFGSLVSLVPSPPLGLFSP